MNQTDKDTIKDAIRSALTDEYGVSESTFGKFKDVATIVKDNDLTELLYHVDATDGRFYLPDEE